MGNYPSWLTFLIAALIILAVLWLLGIQVRAN